MGSFMRDNVVTELDQALSKLHQSGWLCRYSATASKHQIVSMSPGSSDRSVRYTRPALTHMRWYICAFAACLGIPVIHSLAPFPSQGAADLLMTNRLCPHECSPASICSYTHSPPSLPHIGWRSETGRARGLLCPLYVLTARDAAADRLYTAWLPIVKAKNRRVPHLRVTFTTVGDEIRSVSTSITELEGTFLQRHLRLVSEFDDPEAWPKHLVIEYIWEQYTDTDPEGGLAMMLFSCTPRLPTTSLCAQALFTPSLLLICALMSPTATPSAWCGKATNPDSIAPPPPFRAIARPATANQRYCEQPLARLHPADPNPCH